jgi:putative spermidine/putrescine transport system substrate-binding protein
MRRIAVIATALLATGCSAPATPGGSGSTAGPVPDKPGSAVTINVLDVAGNLQLTQGMIDEFTQKHQDQIAKVTYTKATAP